MANKPRILVALTCQRYIFASTATCLLDAIMRTQRHYEVAFHTEMACDVVAARNRCVLAAQKAGATHILFVDYDMHFPNDAIENILAHDKDIVGAAYNFRSDPPRSTAVVLGTEGHVSPDELPKDIFKAETLGAGFLLIKMSVFDTLKQPWFMWGYKADGTLLYGEDTYFCQHAIKEAGFDVWGDPTLNVKHIGEQLF